MKKRIMLFGLAVAMAFGSAFTAFAQSELEEAAGPKCNYTTCPGGISRCCTQDGVTLYNWA